MTKYWNIFLHASWNFAEIEELIGMGSGGGAQLGIGNPPRRNELGIGEQLGVKSYELRKSEKVILKESKNLKDLKKLFQMIL